MVGELDVRVQESPVRIRGVCRGLEQMALELLRRLLISVQGQQSESEPVAQLRGAGRQFPRLSQRGQCAFELGGEIEVHSQKIVSRGLSGVQTDCGPKPVDRRVQSIQIMQEQAQIHLCFRETGRHPDDFEIGGLRLGVVPLLVGFDPSAKRLENGTVRVQTPNLVGTGVSNQQAFRGSRLGKAKFLRPCQFSSGLLGLSRLAVQEPQRVAGLAVIRVQANAAFEKFLRLLQPAVLQSQAAQRRKCFGMVGAQGNDLGATKRPVTTIPRPEPPCTGR